MAENVKKPETKEKLKPLPVSMAIAACRRALTQELNGSGLPPCVLELIVGQLHQELAGMAAEQAARDAAEYGKMEEDA